MNVGVDIIMTILYLNYSKTFWVSSLALFVKQVEKCLFLHEIKP